MNKMQMPIGTKLRCKEAHLPNANVEVGKEYTFLGYDENQIPKNKQNAVMTWYPDKPIWTSEEYDHIREKFMMIKLEGVTHSQWLSHFEVIS
jgi:hypothetical protein